MADKIRIVDPSVSTRKRHEAELAQKDARIEELQLLVTSLEMELAAEKQRAQQIPALQAQLEILNPFAELKRLHTMELETIKNTHTLQAEELKIQIEALEKALAPPPSPVSADDIAHWKMV
jgi:hypothetical protein